MHKIIKFLVGLILINVIWETLRFRGYYSTPSTDTEAFIKFFIGFIIIKTLYETFRLEKYNPTISIKTLMSYSLLACLGGALASTLPFAVIHLIFFAGILPKGLGIAFIAILPVIILLSYIFLYLGNLKSAHLLSKTLYKNTLIENYAPICSESYLIGGGIVLLIPLVKLLL